MAHMSDIVRFKKPRTEAGEFCKSYGITGKVVAANHDMVVIDAGLEYNVYAFPDEIEVIINSSMAPIGSDE